MSQKNPIKFLDSYSKDDKDIFFGRDKETSDLYEKISKSKVVLLYGLSGTGKTSLVQCGLENRYEADQLLFIYIRRGTDIIKSFKQAISVEASSLIHPLAGPAEALETLYFDYLKPIIIIFDQFEELFISGDMEEREIFISTIANILNSNLKVKFIFSLREEYLAHMDEFEEEIPSIYDLRQRLEKMRRSTLEEVITKIAEKGGTELESDKVPGMIIDNISDRKGHVELPYLQVYLDKLTRLMNKSGGGKVLTSDFLEQAGELKDVLGDFLEEQISIIASEVSSKEAINHLLKQLITHDGTKSQIVFADIKPYGNTTSEQVKVILTKLEDSRIIKLEDGLYELSHDSLARKIAEKRTTEEIQLIEVIKFLKNANNSFKKTETLLDRKQLKYVQPYLHLLELNDDEKQLLDKSQSKVKKITVVKYIIYASVFIALLVSGYFWQDKRYNDIKEQGDNYMNQAKYSEAKLIYEQALNIVHWHFVNKNETKDSIARCDTLIKLKKPYNRFYRAGDSLFNLGVSNYKNAFDEYNKAKETGYNPKEINALIKNRSKDAAKKYSELAKFEYEGKHKDLAFALISEAYVLSGTNDLLEQINNWLRKSSAADVKRAISQLKTSKYFEDEETERANALIKIYTEK